MHKTRVDKHYTQLFESTGQSVCIRSQHFHNLFSPNFPQISTQNNDDVPNQHDDEFGDCPYNVFILLYTHYFEDRLFKINIFLTKYLIAIVVSIAEKLLHSIYLLITYVSKTNSFVLSKVPKSFVDMFAKKYSIGRCDTI